MFYALIDSLALGLLVGVFAHLINSSTWNSERNSVLMGIISSVSSLFILEMFGLGFNLAYQIMLTILILSLIKMVSRFDNQKNKKSTLSRYIINKNRH